MSEQTGFLVAMMASGAGFFVILVVLPFFATIVFPYALLLQIGKEEQVKRLERKVLVSGAIIYLIYLVLLIVLLSNPQGV